MILNGNSFNGNYKRNNLFSVSIYAASCFAQMNFQFANIFPNIFLLTNTDIRIECRMYNTFRNLTVS